MPSDEDPLARVVGARAPALAAAAQEVTDGLGDSRGPDAAIIGNVNVDILLWPAGAVPPPGQEWIIETAHVRPGGAAANAALTMAGLGARPRLIGCVGDDSLGRDLIASLARAGIGHEVAVIAGTQTGVSVAFQAPGRDRSFLMALGSLARFGVADIPADAAASARLLLCGYFTLPLLRGQPTADLLATARAAGTMTFLDPGWDPRGWPPEVRAEITTLLPLVDVFLPNAQEASALTGIENPGLAARAIRGSGSNAVIVKLGAAGCLALGPDGRELRVPAPAVTVTDATGAGDALNGALMSALAAGASWQDAVSFSVRAASAVAARPSHARYPRMADVPNVPPNGDLWPISRADHAAYTDQAARSEGEAGVAAIGLERLTKVFADGTRAVSDLDLDIPDGCLMVLVGPSGCGKTTVLRMVAGLEQVTDGEVRIGERAVTRLAAKDRDVAMVFQNYALYPQMTAYQNMAFALRLRKLVRPEVDRRVREAARVLGIEDLLGKKPRHLSGGQRQRVAMGRAIVREPRAFLMDEPLSNLDAKLRVQMRAEISRIQQRLGTTTIYVTHDQVEAMTIGHLVAVMSAGELQQVGTPQEIYGCPANVFVATFIGSPSMNLVAASLRASDGEVWADFADSHLRLPTPTLAEHPGLAGYVGRNLILGLRPEHMQETAGRGQVPADRCIHATVEHREVMGAEAYLHVSLAGQNVPGAEPAPEEDAGGASLSGAGVPFVARVAGTSPAAVGDKIDIAVDATNLYFFDPGSQHVIAA